MLWADKYRPKDFSELDYHQDRGLQLKNLTKDGDFPHLLIYGPLGAGKKTRIMCLLKELYGPGVERLKVENQNFTTPSNKKLEITTVSSNYHIEVNPSDVGINDRVVIMDVIKNVAQTQQLNSNAQREFKVILLTDVDDLTKDAQHALRRTMEKYISTCRIILCTTSISRVIPAIRSRCLCIRIPAPTNNEILKVLKQVGAKEDFKISDNLAKEIIEKCDRNLRRALLMLEASKVEGTEKVIEPDWQSFIRQIGTKVAKQQNIAVLGQIREDLYELISFGIPTDVIFRNLLEEMLSNCDQELAPKIIEQAAIYEHRMTKGNKQIFHLEAFIAKCMCLFQKMMMELLDDFNL